MKKHIVKAIKDRIADLEEKYAINWIAKEEHSAVIPVSDESQKQIDAATHNMEKALERIDWYTKLLKTQEK